MRDIVVPPGEDVDLERAEEDAPSGDDDVIGCLPRLFATAHREEVEAIVEGIPEYAASSDIRMLESRFERYQKLLDLYQEQPNLLDESIPSLLARLLSFVRLPAADCPSKLDLQSTIALQFCNHLAKVRGYKVITRLLPHEVTNLEPLIVCLEQYVGPVSQDLAERQMLLLWLTIVCKNPFDLRRFDGTNAEGTTIRRIFDLAMPYLQTSWNRTHYACALLLSSCLSRLDGRPLLSSSLDRILAVIESALAEQSPEATFVSRTAADRLTGALILLLAILKHVDRTLLMSHVSRVVDCARRFPSPSVAPSIASSSEGDSRVRKCVVKLVQRIALILLKPKLAKWRYTRGRRYIEVNLGAVTKIDVNQNAATPDESGMEVETEESDEEDDPDDTVAWSLDIVLRSLSDVDTTVRWSAAKGVGRICARLGKEFASQVIANILESKFHRRAGYSSWHGGCLALAELSRRGCLLPEFLPRAFDVVSEALFYQEPTGRMAIGTNVRDSACYVFWAWARAYEANELKPYIEGVATALMCVALFDREVNIRRAASAAFQENVGRQKTFPDGIALLTIADYFAVGNRKRSFIQLPIQVASYEKYVRPMIDHLVAHKMSHWDESVRELAALALEKLCEKASEYLNELLIDRILPCIRTTDPITRHGHILSAFRIYKGLVMNGGVRRENEVLSVLAPLSSWMLGECEKSKASGGEVSKKAMAHGIRVLAESAMKLDQQEVIGCLRVLQLLSSDDNRSISDLALLAVRPFFTQYVNSDKQNAAFVAGECVSVLSNAAREGEKIGACVFASCLLPEHIDAALFDAIAKTIQRPTDMEKLWAFARQAAIRVVSVAGRNPGHSRESFRLLCVGTQDYTKDQRGDLGRFVRQEALVGMSTMAAEGLLIESEVEEAVKRMVNQSAEKILNTRVCACECILTVLSSPCAASLASVDLLHSIYTDPGLFSSDSVLLSLSPLLLSHVFYLPLMRGLITSAGGVSEGTSRVAIQGILEYLESVDESDEKVDEVLEVFADMLNESLIRLSLSALRVLPRILGNIRSIEEYPDKCQPLNRIAQKMVKVAANAKNPVWSRLALETCASLLGVNRDSQIWRICAENCVRGLNSPVPAIRRSAAEGLYEGLCVAGHVDEDVLLALSETSWLDNNEMDSIEKASRTVYERLLTA